MVTIHYYQFVAAGNMSKIEQKNNKKFEISIHHYADNYQ